MEVKNFKRTKLACYTAYFTMSSIFSLPPLLFATLQDMYGISYTLLGTLVLTNFCTQLTIDLIFTVFTKYFNVKKIVRVMPLITIVLPGMCLIALALVQPKALSVVLLSLMFVIPVMGDTLAFLVGSRVGGPKLCPRISPNKTIAGAVGGLAGSVLFSMALCGIGSIFGPVQPLWHYMIVGFLCGIAGQLGDLFASLIKRHCGVKDFGTIFPGHGGMMDRLDSVYWATVIVYVYLNLFMIAG